MNPRKHLAKGIFQGDRFEILLSFLAKEDAQNPWISKYLYQLPDPVFRFSSFPLPQEINSVDQGKIQVMRLYIVFFLIHVCFMKVLNATASSELLNNYEM